MSNKENIVWNNSTNNNLKYGSIRENFGRIISQIIMDAVCVLLFIMSALYILLDSFTWADIDILGVAVMVVVVLVVSALLEISYYLPGIKGSILCLAVMVTGIVSILVYLFVYENIYDIISGILKMAGSYIKYWNQYYGTVYYVVGGRITDVVETINFLSIVLAFLFLCIAKISGKNMVTIVVPIATLIMEFVVSRSPELRGLILMFVGVLVANASPWKVENFKLSLSNDMKDKIMIKNNVWVIVGLIALVFGFGIGMVGEEPASILTDYSTEVKRFHMNLTAELSDLSVLDLLPGLGTSKVEKISNDAPVYMDIDMLMVEMDNRPYGNMYLKGHSVGDYKNGQWDYDEKDFKKECKKAGFDYVTIKEELNNLPLVKVLDGYDAESLSDTSYGEYIKIKYTNSVGTRAYFPYFAEVNNVKVIPKGDAYLEKKRSLEEVEFWVWYYADKYEAEIFLLNRGEELEWEDWYNDFVLEQYLETSGDVPTAGVIAEELYQNGDDEYDGMKVTTKNFNRMSKAYRVAQWMEKNTRYSINLQSISKDTDPVEFFLSESRKGYCIHYASAATLILREMGVPARMVTGYIVPITSFTYDEGKYQAFVMDSNSHAWVEIYLEGIGWVPVEVTKGYVEKAWESNFEHPIDDKKEPQTSENKTEYETQSSETQSTTIKPQESSTTKPAQNETNERATTKPREKETTVNNNSSKTSGNSDAFAVFIIIVIVVVIVVAMVVVIVYMIIEKGEKNILEQKKQKKTLNVIKLINRRLYKKLRFTGKISKSIITDLEYEEILKNNYVDISKEEWVKYMEIAKASAFSNKDFTEEEMEFCYNIYRKTMKENKNS